MENTDSRKGSLARTKISVFTGPERVSLIESSADARLVSRIDMHVAVVLHQPRVEVVYLSELFGLFVAIWLTDMHDSCTGNDMQTRKEEREIAADKEMQREKE
ncbi:hypothetical protein ACS0PU_002160 [Formica fusca]